MQRITLSQLREKMIRETESMLTYMLDQWQRGGLPRIPLIIRQTAQITVSRDTTQKDRSQLQ